METLIFFILLIVIGFEFYFFRTLEQLKKQESKVVVKAEKSNIDKLQEQRKEELRKKEEIKKREKLRKSFDSLFNYDYETALGKKEEWYKG